MGKIIIEGMEFYAYHGHFAEEQIIGNYFNIDLIIETDIEKAAKSDDLIDAVDYQQVYNEVKDEMQTKSALIENIASRILDRLMLKFITINRIVIKLSKINPPLGGKVQKVSVKMERKR